VLTTVAAAPTGNWLSINGDIDTGMVVAGKPGSFLPSGPAVSGRSGSRWGSYCGACWCFENPPLINLNEHGTFLMLNHADGVVRRLQSTRPALRRMPLIASVHHDSYPLSVFARKSFSRYSQAASSEANCLKSDSDNFSL
jgi:hypothetical protein